MKQTYQPQDIVTLTIEGSTHYAKVLQVKGTIINVKPDGLPARDVHINALSPTNSVQPGSQYIEHPTPIPYEEGMMRAEE